MVMTEMCRCCGQVLGEYVFKAHIFDRLVSFFECDRCGYVQTEEPDWLDIAYASPINISDTGILARNFSNVSLVLATLTTMKSKKSQVVDYAGGYGFLVRLLRDVGVDAFWADLYSENLVARGFEYEGFGNPKLVTAFEAFEHFLSPAEELSNLLKISPNVLLTTTLVPKPTPKPQDWWYYGLEHGQHIGFFRVRTLNYLADKFNLHLLTDGKSCHFFSEKKYSYLTWNIFRKIARFAPKVFSYDLAPKTFDDHLSFRK